MTLFELGFNPSSFRPLQVGRGVVADEMGIRFAEGFRPLQVGRGVVASTPGPQGEGEVSDPYKLVGV